MTSKFSLLRLICGTLLAFGILVFVVLGMQDTWRDYVAKDYDKHLTEQVYVEAVVNQNANLVFYRTGCPYCEAGKTAVVVAAQKSVYPTFYIDVESEKGQQLVKQYQVEKAATIITLRDGESQHYLYAKKTQAGEITANTKNIKEAFND